ncbi:MAG: hypothetical protein LBL24_08865, partial [Bacteroidales bacterium]|nr:hypothetical protein [Bacteroidales bacterium]
MNRFTGKRTEAQATSPQNNGTFEMIDRESHCVLDPASGQPQGSHLHPIQNSKFKIQNYLTAPRAIQNSKFKIQNYLILVALCFAGVAGAQTKPGGITTSGVDTELWMRADALPDLLTKAHGAVITTWNDLSGNNRHHTGISYLNKTGWVENYTTKPYMMNYQPSLYFAGTAQLTAPMFYDAGKAYYVFYVAEQVNPDASTYFNTVYSFEDGHTYGENVSGWHD